MIFKRDDGGRTTRPREPPSTGPRTTGEDERWRSRARSRSLERVHARGQRGVGGILRIDGQVKGQINADGDVTLSPQSQVEADIRAQNVSVAGRFKGNISSKGKAHLARGGRIEGNITSKTLVVEEGGRLPRPEPDGRSGHGTARRAERAAGRAAAGIREEGERPTQVKVP